MDDLQKWADFGILARGALAIAACMSSFCFLGFKSNYCIVGLDLESCYDMTAISLGIIHGLFILFLSYTFFHPLIQRRLNHSFLFASHSACCDRCNMEVTSARG